MFELEHFEVQKNPGVASPRQTDLMARYGALTYLIESKWQRRHVGTPELDSLRARMRRAAPGSVGVLICIGRFVSRIGDDIEQDRSHPILLVSRGELERVLWGSGSLRDLLRRKFDALVVNGRAAVDLDEPRADIVEMLERRRVRTSSIRVETLTGQTRPWVEATGKFDVWLPALTLPDPDWAWQGGTTSVYTRVAIEKSRPNTVLQVIEELGRTGWLEHGSSWVIRQSGRNWFGFDDSSLRLALDKWQERYEALGNSPHHTEEVAVVGRTDDNGFWVLEADIDGHHPRWVRHCELSLVLEGWPLDPEPLRRLLRATGARSPHVLRTLNTSVLTKAWEPRQPATSLQVVARIVALESREAGEAEEWVVGLVVRNPGPPMTAEDIERRPWRAWIRDYDVVPVALRSWHQHDEIERTYSLLWAEWSELAGSVPGVLMADWD